MATNSSIEWTDTTWNPVSGCTRASDGCDHCYAVTMTHRLEAMGQQKYSGLTVLNGKGDRHFNGQVRTHEDALALPLAWRKPRRVFVNSMSDLFHRDVPFEFVDKVFAVMALTPQHTYQVLTKRPERMAEYLTTAASPLDRDRWDIVSEWAVHIGRIVWDPRGSDVTNYYDIAGGTRGRDFSNRRVPPGWPLPNVWLGASVEYQQRADERIPHLLRCPAAVRFLSCEPLLGAVSLRWLAAFPENAPTTAMHPSGTTCHLDGLRRIDWVIVGGESGPGSRPMHPDWARGLRDQCQAAGVAFFFKQWGEWIGGTYDTRKGKFVSVEPYNHIFWTNPRHPPLKTFKPADFPWRLHAAARVGKKAAGRLLDGREWNEMPEVDQGPPLTTCSSQRATNPSP